MKNTIALPALQVAAAAFFATTCQAETYCVNEASRVVARENCNSNGPDGRRPQEGGGNYFLVEGAPGATPGTEIPKMSARMAGSGYVSGGFGRKRCDPNKEDCSGG